jgi:hypothetical protein
MRMGIVQMRGIMDHDGEWDFGSGGCLEESMRLSLSKMILTFTWPVETDPRYSDARFVIVYIPLVSDTT